MAQPGPELWMPEKGAPLTDPDAVKDRAPLVKLLVFAPMVVGWSWLAVREGAFDRWTWVLYALGGPVLWTFLEYLIHRFVFHHWPSVRWMQEIQLHVKHHRQPTSLKYSVSPLWFTVPASFAVWGLAGLAIGSWGSASLLLATAALAYCGFEWVHYSAHYRRGGNRVVRYWRRYHLHHHMAAPDRCFGFTTPVWDVLFRTHWSKGRAAVSASADAQPAEPAAR
jgi:sterol desaturase/sphingolipid hydroxylase (fatty acid hydroxylase superfamily)